MKKNILLRTNLLVCLIIVAGFLLTAVLSYRASYNASVENIEQVSYLTSEGIYYQMSSTFTKPVNISLTMANDSLLKDFLSREQDHLEDAAYIQTIQRYLAAYQDKYAYDSVFLVSTATSRYYNFHGLDRVLTEDNPENVWYYAMLQDDADYTMNVDNDEVSGAGNEITVFVNCKIKSDDGAVIGVVGVGLRIQTLQGLLQSYQDNYGVNAYLLDDAGIIEISSEHTGYEAVDFFDVDRYDDDARRQILDWKAQGSAHSFWAADQTNKQYVNYIVARYLPELNWHLVVERDTGALIAELNRQLAITVAVITAIIAVILIVITRVIRSFNRRIVSLTQSVEQERRTVFEKATEQLYENIYELDITHNRPANRATERYFESLGAPAGTPYDQALHIVAEKQIKAEFRDGYIDTFRPDNVLRAYEEGQETLRYDCMISTGGDYYWMRITARIVRWDSDGSIHLLTYRQNIDAEKQRESRMHQLAQTDEMTGLYTKTAAMRRIDELLQTEPRQPLYAYFILDIDNFKQANDRYGHAFGDTVILAFTQTIRAQFRHDDLLGRIGGDEFVAFLAVPDRQWAQVKAQQLTQALDRQHSWNGMEWPMSASIGVAFAPADGQDAETLYTKADIALYQTKERGKNGYTLYEP